MWVWASVRTRETQHVPPPHSLPLRTQTPPPLFPKSERVENIPTPTVVGPDDGLPTPLSVVHLSCYRPSETFGCPHNNKQTNNGVAGVGKGGSGGGTGEVRWAAKHADRLFADWPCSLYPVPSLRPLLLSPFPFESPSTDPSPPFYPSPLLLTEQIGKKHGLQRDVCTGDLAAKKTKKQKNSKKKRLFTPPNPPPPQTQQRLSKRQNK